MREGYIHGCIARLDGLNSVGDYGHCSRGGHKEGGVILREILSSVLRQIHVNLHLSRKSG